MMDAPRQDWTAYEALTARENAAWIRGLSPQHRFAIYEDLFNVIWAVPRSPAEKERIEQRRWDQKLALRVRQVEAFTKLDLLRRERAAANYSG